MFLQVAVPSDDSRCLRFLWREDPEQRIEVYEYTRHFFREKSSPTCANYALHQVAKYNAIDDENLVKVVQRNFYMDDFLKSVRTLQEAIQLYQKVRKLLIKGGFNLTKWITNDEEVKSQISEADTSTKIVKQSFSKLEMNWNVDRGSLRVCRGTEQEVPAKITQRIVLSFVSAVFDPLGIFSQFRIGMRFLLKSIWAAMGKAWDRELTTVHSNLFSDWCSEAREIISTWFRKRPFKLETPHFQTRQKKQCASWHIYNTRQRWNSPVIWKCRVAPIRHTTIPKLELRSAVYVVGLSRQILREHIRIAKKLSLDQLISSLTVVTVSSQETASVCCKQGSRNTGKLFHGSKETSKRNQKPSRYWHERDVHRRPQGVRLVKRASTAPDRCWKVAKGKKVAKAVVPSERSRVHTVASTELEIHCPLHEVQDEAEETPQSRRNPSSRTNTFLICSKR